MVEINPSEKPEGSDHIPLTPKGADSSVSFQDTYQNSGQGFKNFKQWLGPKGYKQFMNGICKSIANQISQQKAKEKKAARQLRDAETGKGMYND